jgi:PKD repeat protein
MVSVFMISRRSSTAWLAFAIASLMSAAACERVPLLAPSGSTITLTTPTTALPVNGTTRIVAQIIEAAGTPPQHGTHVTFTTTLGTIQPAEAETDVSGQAIATFNAGGASGTATITAISGGANVGSTGALKILVGSAAVGGVTATANPTILPAGGGSSNITASVVDVNGNPLVSAQVQFSTTAGTLSTTLVTTDQAGIAQTVLTTAIKAVVTASVGLPPNATPTPTPTAPTTPAPTTPTRSSSTPSAAGQASNTVTVDVAGTPTLQIALATTQTNPPTAGVAVAFTFTATVEPTNKSPIRSVIVSWGDGQTSNLGAITGATTNSHVFASPGTYIVSGTVTDSFGTSSSSSISVTINPKPQATVALKVDTTNPTAGTDVQFTGTVTAAANTNTVIQSVMMDYGDGNTQDLGSTSGTITLHHVYQNGGNYTATLTATDSNNSTGRGVTTLFVQTATPLTVLLSATPTFGTTTTTESFTATVIGLGNSVAVNFQWNFGDGRSANTSSNTITQTYAHPSGPFTVTVTVTTSTGQTAQGSTVIQP